MEETAFFWEGGAKRLGLRKHMAEALELPSEIVLDLPLLSLIGREEITIENYKGILEYGEETVRISTAAGVVRLRGSGFCLKRLSAECIVVTGCIAGVEFLG